MVEHLGNLSDALREQVAELPSVFATQSISQPIPYRTVSLRISLLVRSLLSIVRKDLVPADTALESLSYSAGICNQLFLAIKSVRTGILKYNPLYA